MKALIFIACVLVGIIMFLIVSELLKGNKAIKLLKGELSDAQLAAKTYGDILNGMEDINAHYYLSESDALRYKTDAAMLSAIRTRLAMYIANEIIRRVGDPKRVCDGNKTMYEYNIKFYADNDHRAE